MTEKIDHEGLRAQNSAGGFAMHDENGGNGAPLSRQVTVQLSPEQYERLFFAPGPPRRGDLAKRFGRLLPRQISALRHQLIAMLQPIHLCWASFAS